jgi:hypothetical protein
MKRPKSYGFLTIGSNPYIEVTELDEHQICIERVDMIYNTPIGTDEQVDQRVEIMKGNIQHLIEILEDIKADWERNRRG